mgnify:CR=1 FL=1
MINVPDTMIKPIPENRLFDCSLYTFSKPYYFVKKNNSSILRRLGKCHSDQLLTYCTSTNLCFKRINNNVHVYKGN